MSSQEADRMSSSGNLRGNYAPVLPAEPWTAYGWGHKEWPCGHPASKLKRENLRILKLFKWQKEILA